MYKYTLKSVEKLEMFGLQIQGLKVILDFQIIKLSLYDVLFLICYIFKIQFGFKPNLN